MGGEGSVGCSQRSYDRWALGGGGKGWWVGGGGGPGKGGGGERRGPGRGLGRGPVEPAQHKARGLVTGLKKIEIRPGLAR